MSTLSGARVPLSRLETTLPRRGGRRRRPLSLTAIFQEDLARQVIRASDSTLRRRFGQAHHIWRRLLARSGRSSIRSARVWIKDDSRGESRRCLFAGVDELIDGGGAALERYHSGWQIRSLECHVDLIASFQQ